MPIPSRVLSAGTNSLATISICGDGQTGLTASGTTISDAFQLVAVYNTIGTAASGSGVILPITEAGATIWVYNLGANTVKIYAKSGSTIDNGLSSFNLATVSSVVFFATSNTTWASITNYIPSGMGSVTNVSALTLGTTGTDLSSTVVNSTTTPVITLNVPTASASNRGALSSADWTTFNNKGSGSVTSVTGTAPVVSSGGATPAISMAAATGSVNGYLTSTDWTTFNNKGSGSVTSVGGTGTVNGITLTGTVTSSGNLTLGGALSGVNLTSQVTGTLPVANGGTGVTSSTGTGSTVRSASPTFTGTVTAEEINIDIYSSYDKNGFSIVPVINVKTNHNATGDGTTDDLAAINAAINIANVNSGRSLYFPRGTYKVSGPLDTIYKHVKVYGDGRHSTVIAMSSATGNTMTLGAKSALSPNASEGQYGSIEDISFNPSVARTSGYEISIPGYSDGGGYANVIRNVDIQYGFNGINVSASRTMIDNVTMRYMSGNYGIYFAGTSTYAAHGLFIKNIIADNPYNADASQSNLRGNFAASISYIANDVYIANGWIWQVITGGTSGASAPSAPTSVTWGATNVTNGSTTVRAVSPSNLTWLQMDNYSNSLTGVCCAFLNGNIGFKMNDTANTGSSYPSWAYFYDLEIDHSYYAGASLEAGLGFHTDGCWIGSVYTGNGVEFVSNWKGESNIQDTRIVGNGQHGILVNVGTETKIANSFININSASSSGSYNGVTVAANINRFTICGNSVGLIPPFTSSGQSYGIYVSAGTSDYYIIQGNLGQGTTGNVNGTYSDNGTGANKSVTGNI